MEWTKGEKYEYRPNVEKELLYLPETASIQTEQEMMKKPYAGDFLEEKIEKVLYRAT